MVVSSVVGEQPGETAPARGRGPSERALVAIGAAVLTVLALPMSPMAAGPSLDPSWSLGLSLAHVEGLQFGDIGFTYGPLGYLAEPQEVFFRGAVAAIAYSALTAYALYSFLLHGLLRWLPPRVALASAAGFACVAPLEGVAELGGIAVLLWGMAAVRPGQTDRPMPHGTVALLGVVAALQLQVKVGIGGLSIFVAAVVVLARPGRVRGAGVATASFLVALVASWTLAGQGLGNLGPWLHMSASLASGYSEAMAVDGPSSSWWLLLVPLLLLIAAAVVVLRRDPVSHLPLVVLVAAGTWFFVKQGYVRLDPGHRSTTFLALAAVFLVLGWRGWMRGVALAVSGLSLVTPFVLPYRGATVVADSLAAAHFDAPQQVWRIGQLALDGDRRRARLEDQRESLRQVYGLTPTVLEHLVGTVHADPWDVSAVWASQRPWRPVPVFQSYSAYATDLDHRNAEALRGDDAPDSVLRLPIAIDARVVAWESPEYQLALTCLYDSVHQEGEWQVLHRRDDDGRCGDPVLLEEQVLQPGQVGPVPRPRSATSIVAVSISYPLGAVDALATLAVRPLRLPTVELGVDRHRFVLGHADQLHLVRVPATDRDGLGLANAGMAVPSLAFPSAGGAVVARYYEIPIR